MKTEAFLAVTQSSCADNVKDCTIQQYYTTQHAAWLRTQDSSGVSPIDVSMQRIQFIKHVAPTIALKCSGWPLLEQ